MGRPNMATRNELNAFLAQLGTLKKDAKNEEDIKQREVIRSYLQQFDRQELQRLMGRAFADALKSPSQKLGTAKPPSEAPKSEEVRLTRGTPSARASSFFVRAFVSFGSGLLLPGARRLRGRFSGAELLTGTF